MHHLNEVVYYDSLPTPDVVEDKDALEKDLKTEKKDCCGCALVRSLLRCDLFLRKLAGFCALRYFKAYIGCYEGLIERQADEDLQTYQFEMLKNFYDPILEKCECSVGESVDIILVWFCTHDWRCQ